METKNGPTKNGPSLLFNFINGEFVAAIRGRQLTSLNPRTEEVALLLPDSGQEDVELAVQAALRAQPGWFAMGPAQRCSILERVADIIEARSDELSRAESMDQGKPMWLAQQVDIPRAALNFRHFAATAKHDEHSAEPAFIREGVLEYCTRSPVGVVAMITPWNLPLYLLTFKMAPALAYGNSVVAKPSEFTPLTAHLLAEIVKAAGVPDGVVNVVHGTGPGAGSPLCQHPRVNAISFTGSTASGALIFKAAGHTKKVSLELGGKNAALVFDDADLDLAIDTLIRSSFVNSGQVCLATSRIFVQSGIYKTFAEKFVQKARSLTVGPGIDDKLGPLVSKQHFEKVMSYLALARDEGARFLCGKNQDFKKSFAKGYYVKATVLSDLPDNSRCMQEEIFGPVTCLVRFESEQEALRRAEAVPYGLCACIFTGSLDRAHRLANQMQVGTVWVNSWLLRNLHMPFGGAKASGLGREGTKESRDFCTNSRTVCVKYQETS